MQLESFQDNKAENIEKEYQFHFKEIAELESPIKHILDQLRGEINAGTYKIILGDDASGRIPTNIFGKVLARIYKENNFKKPPIRFISANPQIQKVALNERIKKIKSDAHLELADKILIVTDTIASGKHLDPLVRALKGQNISFDISTIGIVGDYAVVSSLQNQWSCRVVFGEEDTPNIYGKRELAGVFKEHGDSVSRSLKRTQIIYGPERVTKAQNIINLAREDVNYLSHKLLKWY